MPRVSVVLAAIAALSTLGCAPKASDTASDTSVQQMGESEDRAAVQRSIDSSMAKFADALNKGDAERMSAIYADDAAIYPPGMKIARGRADIDRANAGMFSAMSFSGAKFTTTELTVLGDHAIETGTYSMTAKPKTGKAMNDVGKFITIWKKQPDGSWKVHRDIFNSDLSM
jgi:uncharacterized protein (TIGR02246 family)